VTSSPPLPKALRAALVAEGTGDSRIPSLLRELLDPPVYRREAAVTLLERARGSHGDSWEVRRLAVLMLQDQLLRLAPSDLDEHVFLLRLLGIAGDSPRIDESVLTEGYSTVQPRGFVRELRRRLAPAARILGRVRGGEAPVTAWRGLLAFARADCKLVLARYLFTPEEVVARIREQVRISRGVESPPPFESVATVKEARLALARLPPFESEVVRRLLSAPAVYWFSEPTETDPHALVAQPPGTVVLVLRLPGSDLEIEIKRSGLPGERLLEVVFQRDGWPVPVSHRLQGGSMLRSLHWDAGASAALSGIYRLVHGAEAPIPRMLAVKSVNSIPWGGRDWHTLDYFGEPAVFGEDFAATRAAMREAVADFEKDEELALPALHGDLGLTLQFLARMAPGQALLCGTSAFRLDRLAGYLRGGEAWWPGTRQAADGILEEVLGAYAPPPVIYRGHWAYVRAAFTVPANRAAADRAFRDAIRDLGTFWGTLLAVRGFSHGESFVGRNLGLMSAWTGGRRRVALVSMDHDGLRVDGRRNESFHPLDALPGMMGDERFIFGLDGRPGSVGFLQSLYHVPEEDGARGQAALRRAMRRAYRRTHTAMREVPELAEHFSPSFLERIGDWDAVARARLRALKAGTGSWRTRAETFLNRRGYGAELVEEHLEAAEKYSDFLARQAFLYAR
jgi:hypothetical protein